jgi:hypothetical protein
MATRIGNNSCTRTERSRLGRIPPPLRCPATLVSTGVTRRLDGVWRCTATTGGPDAPAVLLPAMPSASSIGSRRPVPTTGRAPVWFTYVYAGFIEER